MLGKVRPIGPTSSAVKVSVATTLAAYQGRQFVTHVNALPVNAYDAHTLKTAIPDVEPLVGSTIQRVITDKGCPSHTAPPRGLHKGDVLKVPGELNSFERRSRAVARILEGKSQISNLIRYFDRRYGPVGLLQSPRDG
jgi:hypothetical protein